MKKIIPYLFPSVILLTAVGLAAVAAFISVSGLSKLFAGAGSTILLMTGMIEFSKLITTTYLHKNPVRKNNLTLTVPLYIFTVGIMAITSAGVYGFSGYF